MKTSLLLISAVAFLAACQQPVSQQQADTTPQIDPVTGRPVAEISQIEEDPNRIVLSDSSQEQQKTDRERYAEEMKAIAAQRLLASDVTVPDTPAVNAAAYARATTNQVGQRVYQRSAGFGSGSCRSYATSADAQRDFLANGGPERDPLNIDRDGDGFACAFDPAPYRMLQ